MNNFLPLDRKILDHWLWKDKPFSKGQAWVDLLLLANYKDKKKPIKDTVVTYKRGNVNLSMVQLADRWGWDRRKVKRFLDVLSDDGMVSVNSTTYGTTITIVNYEFFNNSCTTNGTGNGTTDSTTDGTAFGTTDSTTDAQPMVQQVRTTNKDNKDEEGKERENERMKEDAPPMSPSQGEREETQKRKRFIPPTVEEVRIYCNERGNSVNPEQFVDFYESKGWYVGKNKMKDWKAAVRTWERERKQKHGTRNMSGDVNASRQSQLDYLLNSIKEAEQNE